MTLTQLEVDFYIRATLKQNGVSDVTYSFKDMKRSLGYFWAEKNHIVFSYSALASFTRFKEVLLHELAHKLQHVEQGTFKTKSGRNSFHGKDFKRICLTLGIPARRFIP